MKTSLVVVLACLPVFAHAEDAPEYDRPGIGFSTSTVGRGVFAWEQGLPDGSQDRSGGVSTRQWTAATLLRLGLGETTEVQLGADSWSRLRIRGNGAGERDDGGGDGSIALKWAPVLADDRMSIAFKAGTTLPWGKSPLGDNSHDHDVGVSWGLDLGEERALALYADRQWGDSGTGWLFSPSFSFPLAQQVSAYVEGGYGTGAQYMRAAGAGVTWMATPRLQLDASLLRGLDADTTDWQGGIGLSLYFD